MRLRTQAPEIGVSSAFPEGKQNGEKKELLTHHYGGYKLGIKTCENRLIFLIPHPLAVGFPLVPSPWGEG
jgi:hypothetical protein